MVETKQFSSSTNLLTFETAIYSLLVQLNKSWILCTRCLQWLSLLASYTFLFLIELHDILGLHKEKKLLTTIVFLVIVITFSFLCRWLLYQKRAPADFFLSHVVNLLVNTRYTSSVSRYVLNFGNNIYFEQEILLFQFHKIYLEMIFFWQWYE